MHGAIVRERRRQTLETYWQNTCSISEGAQGLGCFAAMQQDNFSGSLTPAPRQASAMSNLFTMSCTLATAFEQRPGMEVTEELRLF